MQVNRIPSKYKSSKAEEVLRRYGEYNRSYHANEYEWQQTLTSWQMYFGAIGEQWDEAARRYKQQRPFTRTAQYNIIKPKVNTFAGYLVADEYDFRYDPVKAVRNSGIEAMENAYYCDKELASYDWHYQAVILDGCIQSGDIEVVVDDTYDPQGSIWFRRILPGRLIRDRYWVSDDDRDCMRAWKHGDYSVDQMLRMFPNMPRNAQVEAEIETLSRMGMDWSNPELEDLQQPFPRLRRTFHVVWDHWVEEVKKERIIALNSDGHWVTFPVVEQNDDGATRLRDFAAANGVVDFSKENAFVMPYKDRIHWCAVLCPELYPDEFLARGKPEIQIQGLPFLQFTCGRDPAGRNQGIVNALIDPQKDLNYNKSKIQEIIAHMMGGGLVYNKHVLEASDIDPEDFEKNWNDPSRAWGLNAKDLASFTKHLQDKQIAAEIIKEALGGIELSDRVTNLPAAMQAETEGANEPASLFAMKLKVGKVGNLTIDRRVRHLRQRMAESYFTQAKISYRGAERQFTSKDGRRKAVLNERLPGGVIRNKVEDIPRCSVTISESPNNLTRQMRIRSELGALMEAGINNYPGMYAILIGELIKSSELPQDRKDMLEQQVQVELAKADISSMATMAQSIAGAKQGELTTLQMQAAIQRMAAQLQQQQTAPQLPEQLSETPRPAHAQMALPKQQGNGGAGGGAQLLAEENNLRPLLEETAV